MNHLPPFQTPLNRHSLTALESWLNQLGAERCCENPCSWKLMQPTWSAQIEMRQDELMVTWDQDGKKSKRCFSYGLPRIDVEAAINQGP